MSMAVQWAQKRAQSDTHVPGLCMCQESSVALKNGPSLLPPQIIQWHSQRLMKGCPMTFAGCEAPRQAGCPPVDISRRSSFSTRTAADLKMPPPRSELACKAGTCFCARNVACELCTVSEAWLCCPKGPRHEPGYPCMHEHTLENQACRNSE